MAGHSHWARIKHRKQIVDAKRGKALSKLSKAIMSAVRVGGADPKTNPRLVTAIEKARDASLANDSIERAIARAAGTAGGEAPEEILYEGYGPGGAAILIEALTDNRNRTASDLRSILEKHGGSLAGAGAVAWNFEKKGILWVKAAGVGTDRLMEAAIECGADDVETEGDPYQVTCVAKDLAKVREALAAAGVPVARAELGMVPKTTVELPEAAAARMVELLEAIEDHDDVQSLYSNFTTADGSAVGSQATA